MLRVLSLPRFLPKIGIVFFLSILIFSTFISLMAFTNFLRVDKIELISDDPAYKLRSIDYLKSENIFFINLEKVELDLLRKNPDLSYLKVNKIYPKTLKIAIKKESALAFFKVNQGFLVLNTQGKIISKKKTRATSLPVINYYQKFDYFAFEAGEKLSFQDVATALRFLQKARDLGLVIDSIDIVGEDVIRFNLEDKTIFFTSVAPQNKQEYEFMTIIKRLKIEGREFKSLDLRFEKPVISFE